MDIVIASAKRTPIGALQGRLANATAPELGSIALRGAVNEAGIDPDRIDLVFFGNVLSAGLGQAPARQAALYAGLPNSIPTVTLNKMCGSGLEAIIQAVRAITVGDASVVVAGGMESMTNAPHLLLGARKGWPLGDGEIVDSLIKDGLWDVYNDMHMGSCAERCAERYEFSREQQDDYAIESYRRAQQAISQGYFTDEIVPVEVGGYKGTTQTVLEDESPGKVDFSKIPALPPAFEQDGTITAANASTINDGAAAVVIADATVARELGLPIEATICGYSGYAHAPEWFTTAPVGALEALFSRLNWTSDSVDLFEINEAFSVVPMAVTKELNLLSDRVNVHGGSVAMGHPIGASGARIVVTLLHALKRRQESRGVATICLGGGEALSLGIELR
jgi:acetyl-CoA C-acetyltransferase